MDNVTVRTKRELTQPEYNYYIFFKIDPKETDVEKIEKLLLQEKCKWTAGLPIQRRFKELYKDVENVMLHDKGYDPKTGDYTVPGARAKELQAAHNLTFNQAAYLARCIGRETGILRKSILEQIYKAGGIKWYTFEELEDSISYLVNQGVKYIDDTQSVIDFRIYEEIEKSLVSARSESIYALLGVTKETVISDIATARKDLYIKNRPLASKIAQNAAIDKILGIAEKIFSNEDSKKKYDDYLLLKGTVWDGLALRRSYGIRRISVDEFSLYLDDIKILLDLSENEATILLCAGLKYYQIIVCGDEEPAHNLVVRNEDECGEANKTKNVRLPKYCPHCHKPLDVQYDDSPKTIEERLTELENTVSEFVSEMDEFKENMLDGLKEWIDIWDQLDELNKLMEDLDDLDD